MQPAYITFNINDYVANKEGMWGYKNNINNKAYHPGGHLHLYELTPSIQVAFSALHGLGKQSLMFCSQFIPLNPAGQVHLR